MNRETSADGQIRVLLVGPSLAYVGGQAVQAQRLLARLRLDPSLQVEFLPVNPELPGALGSLQHIKYVRTIVTTIAYLFSLFRRVPGVTVVHAFSASYWSFLLAPVPAMLVGRMFGRKVILNYHSGEAEDHLARWPGTRLLARLAHRIVVPSAYLVDVFARHGLSASSVFNHVEPDEIPARARRKLTPNFLSNRNLEQHYGVDHVLRAFALVQSRFPEARLKVIGDGSKRVELQKLATELQLEGVSFHGAIAPSEMAEFYEWADVYVNGSEIDNMPLSLIEAFAAGVPVVTTAAGGIPYIVQHEANGLVVDVGDEEGLAREALRLLDDPELTERITRRAHAECLERYTWQAVGQQWRNCYRELTGESRKYGGVTRAAALPSDGAREDTA